ncbi:MAG TPA: sigma-70 family RNA polymerase sigma factor [Streptosporangiaceae bacterium]|nr:sigma-70 family RNA polymerase sigma factor [Streptosporangiaceae bacterium]
MAANTSYGDAALWQAAAAGEHAAFGQLFDRHATAVYNYLYRRTADWSAAEDLTAAVFLQAWRRRREVVFDRDSALPWLLGVARLQLRNATRSRARYLAALSRIGRQAVTESAVADPADLVVSRLHDAQQVRELRAAIAGLPRQQREVIELCVYAGLDQQAAALSLGVPVSTVKSRLHRARHRLANELHPPRPGSPAGHREEL